MECKKLPNPPKVEPPFCELTLTEDEALLLLVLVGNLAGGEGQTYSISHETSFSGGIEGALMHRGFSKDGNDLRDMTNRLYRILSDTIDEEDAF